MNILTSILVFMIGVIVGAVGTVLYLNGGEYEQ